jgi:hypothetical protein
MNLMSILRQPMLHFVLIGVAFFAIHSWLAPLDSGGARIVVSQSVVNDLAGRYESAWGKAPSEEVLANLIESYVRDEILYREGVALGLDRDDPVIKRRVRQKLDIISEEASTGPAPTDAELSAYLARHPEQFAQPGLVSFEQIFFDGTASVTEVNISIAAARRAIAQGVDPSKLGQASMLPRQQAGASLDIVARDFGARFAQQLAQAPLDQWTGPVASGFGAHLVRVTARSPAALPSLAAVRPLVKREWENTRRVRSLNESYRRMRERYKVVIEDMTAISARPDVQDQSVAAR